MKSHKCKFSSLCKVCHLNLLKKHCRYHNTLWINNHLCINVEPPGEAADIARPRASLKLCTCSYSAKLITILSRIIKNDFQTRICHGYSMCYSPSILSSSSRSHAANFNWNLCQYWILHSMLSTWSGVSGHEWKLSLWCWLPFQWWLLLRCSMSRK